MPEGQKSDRGVAGRVQALQVLEGTVPEYVPNTSASGGARWRSSSCHRTESAAWVTLQYTTERAPG